MWQKSTGVPEVSWHAWISSLQHLNPSMWMKVLVQVLTKIAPVKHVKNTSRSSNHYVGYISLELLHLVTDVSATNAGMAGSTHVVSKGKNHFLDLRSDRNKLDLLISVSRIHMHEVRLKEVTCYWINSISCFRWTTNWIQLQGLHQHQAKVKCAHSMKQSLAHGMSRLGWTWAVYFSLNRYRKVPLRHCLAQLIRESRFKVLLERELSKRLATYI